VSRFTIGIVGGSGYIGSALADYLSRTFNVKVLDKSSLPRVFKGRNIEYRSCNIVEFEEVKRALKNVDIVIHTAIVQIPLINEQKKLGYEVNIVGTQNICKVVNDTKPIKGMILSGTWHVFGERELKGVIDEEFGFRPDMVEERARLYALSKIAQEVIVRMYDELSDKTYSVIRMGTVLGEGMPEKTAAKIFIARGIRGEPLTPYKHSLYRPMLYVDINDVCRAFESYTLRILNDEANKNANSLGHVINLYWPKPITIIELSYMIRNSIVRLTKGRIRPEMEVIEKGLPAFYTVQSKEQIKVNVNKALNWLRLKMLTDPEESIERIVKNCLSENR